VFPPAFSVLASRKDLTVEKTELNQPAPNLLTELLALYRAKHLRSGAAGTIAQYEITLRHLDRHLKRPATLDDLSDDLTQDLLAWFVSQGRTARGANKLRSNLHTLWSFACRNGWCSRWPDSKPLVEPKRLPTAWSPEQLRALHEAVSSLPGTILGIPRSLWWSALHAVIWDTAERIGAVMQLRWDDVQLDDRRVTFRAETRKNKREDLQHQLHADTVALLKRMKTAGYARVFAWNRHPLHLWAAYKRILRKAGLPHDRKHSFHCMRRSSASYFEAAGGNSTSLLGHSSRDVTTKHYLDLNITQEGKASPADVLPRMGEAVVPEKTDLSRRKGRKAPEVVEQTDEADDDAPPMPSAARVIPEEKPKRSPDDLIARNRLMTTVDVGGVDHRITVGQAAVLSILRARPEGVERHELFEQLKMEGYTAKASVFHLVRRLRVWLKAAYAVPAGWDPLPEEFAGEEVSKAALCPKRLKILRIRLPERKADAGPEGAMSEWDVAHDLSDDRVRRSSRIFLRGSAHLVAFTDAYLLELVRGGEPVSLSEIELRFKTLGYGGSTVTSAVRDARKFLRRVYELPESFDPLPVTGSPKGPGAVGRGNVQLDLPADNS
jgi:integrase